MAGPPPASSEAPCGRPADPCAPSLLYAQQPQRGCSPPSSPHRQTDTHPASYSLSRLLPGASHGCRSCRLSVPFGGWAGAGVGLEREAPGAGRLTQAAEARAGCRALERTWSFGRPALRRGEGERRRSAWRPREAEATRAANARRGEEGRGRGGRRAEPSRGGAGAGGEGVPPRGETGEAARSTWTRQEGRRAEPRGAAAEAAKGARPRAKRGEWESEAARLEGRAKEHLHTRPPEASKTAKAMPTEAEGRD